MKTCDIIAMGDSMKKKSLFFNFFMSITILVSVPMLIIVIILSFELMRYSESEIGKSYIGKLKVASNMTEMLVENIYFDALRITLDGELDSLVNIKNYDDILENQDGITLFYQIQDSVENLTDANMILHSVYLVPEDADFVISSNKNISRLSDFYDRDWIDEYLAFREFKSKSGWMLTRTINGSDKVITFFYMFTPYTTAVDGTIVFNLRENELRDLINTNSVLTEGYIIVVNTDKDIITHIDEGKVGQRLEEGYINDILARTDAEGYIVSDSGNERQLITYYKAGFNDWIYIGVFPMDMLMGKVNNVMIRTFILCFVMIIAGIVISYFVSRRISAPLKKLVKDIKDKSGIYINDDDTNDNETDILSNAFEALVKEGERLCAVIEKTTKVKAPEKQNGEQILPECDHRQNKTYFEIAIDYIRNNYKKDIDINIIAEHVGISYSHMRKVFKDETGDNITNYINRMRIDESKQLLTGTGMTVREIALRLGYNNEQSFIRFFKKYMEISPGEYRHAPKLTSAPPTEEKAESEEAKAGVESEEAT